MASLSRLCPSLVLAGITAGCAYLTPLPDLPRTNVPPPAAPPAPLPPEALRPSARRLVGRVLSVDASRGFVFITLANDPPAAALADGAELIARKDDMTPTATLRSSRYSRGRVLGTQLLQGQPAPGDEVVWEAP